MAGVIPLLENVDRAVRLPPSSSCIRLSWRCIPVFESNHADHMSSGGLFSRKVFGSNVSDLPLEQLNALTSGYASRKSEDRREGPRAAAWRRVIVSSRILGALPQQRRDEALVACDASGLRKVR
jgi:hypothetical protein